MTTLHREKQKLPLTFQLRVQKPLMTSIAMVKNTVR